MPDSAAIRPDGQIQYIGYSPMKSTVRGITRSHIVIHHPGGSYTDNGGEHYVSARFEVMEYESITRGNEEGSFFIRFSRTPKTRTVSFHPTKKKKKRFSRLW